MKTILLLFAACTLLASCANPYFTAQPDYYKRTNPTDPEAELGVLIKAGPKLIQPVK